MIDVVALGADAEMQVDAGPVADLCVVDAGHAGLTRQVRKGPVGRLHLGVVGDADFQLPRPEAHALGKEIAVLFRVLLPIGILVRDLLL